MRPPMDRQKFFDDRAELRLVESKRHYHALLQSYYRFLIPEGKKVLEIGCGLGDLLASVKPSRGVGIDFSEKTIELAKERHPDLEFQVCEANSIKSRTQFDYIIISDLVNDLDDVQVLLEKLHQNSGPKTRIVINYFNNLWRPILKVAEWLGAKAPSPNPNWLSKSDVENLLHLSGWEVVKSEARNLLPMDFPILGTILNRFIAPLPIINHLCLSVFTVARPEPVTKEDQHYRCSVVIPARNESENIQDAIDRTPEMGLGTELLFIEGNSTDDTWETIQAAKEKHPERNIRIMQQSGKGKGNAVREAFAEASGDILFILDADLTVPPEDLPKFYEAIRSGKADFVNGMRLVYPKENDSLQFLNMTANKIFGLTFTWLLGQNVKDTLCCTKALFRKDYDEIARNRSYFGDFDPFGGFDLLFGAARLNMRILDLPIRYQARSDGRTNISRWSQGWLLLKMVKIASGRFKFFG